MVTARLEVTREGSSQCDNTVPRRAAEPPRSVFGPDEAAKRRLSVETDVRTFGDGDRLNQLGAVGAGGNAGPHF
jgi:hypothetical protein